MPITRSKTSKMDREATQKVEETLLKLTSVLDKLSANNAHLGESILKMNQSIENNLAGLNNSFVQLSVDISKTMARVDDSGAAGINRNLDKNELNGSVSDVNCCQQVSKNYIALWKDLGGANLHFSPGGSVHPVGFMKKLTNIFEEAGVPAEKKISLAVSCLRGSAQDWGVLKEDSVVEFDKFKKLFLRRYWGIEEERKAFNNIKFGLYEHGSKADYLFKIVREAKYLSQPLTDQEIISYVTNHFPPDIRRGIINCQSQSLDDIEMYLRKIDSTYVNTNSRMDSGTANRAYTARNNVQNSGNNNQQNNNFRNYNRRNGNAEDDWGESRNSGGQPNVNPVATIFNNNYDDLLSDVEDEVPATNKVMPTVHVDIESVTTQALIDSGSQVSCVSKSFFEKLIKVNSRIPSIPAKCVTLVGALGDKNQKVQNQTLLTFRFEDFEVDYTCLVVPNLIRDVIFGCDFMRDYRVTINFSENYIQGVFGEERRVYFTGQLSNSMLVSVSEISDELFENKRIIRSLTYYTKEEICHVAMQAEQFSNNDKDKLCELLITHQDIFSNEPGFTDVYEHVIVLNDYTPFYVTRIDEVRRQISEMVNWGVIQKSRT